MVWVSEIPSEKPTAPDRFAVRRAATEDARAIARILRLSFAGYKPKYSAKAYRATVLKPADIIGRLGEGPTWVATSNDGLIGTISALVTSEGLYVRSMAVSPASQGRGVGHALLGAVQVFAEQNGLTRMYLSTTPFLTAAIRLYEESGFVHCPGGPSDLFGTPLFTMSKTVP